MNFSINGFHLIEILIAIAIISIVTAIGVPSYTHYLVQERRMEAEGMLSKLAIAMENYAIDQHQYTGATLKELNFSEQIINHHYQLIIQSADETEFLLAAIPTSQQAEQDTQCGTLLLDSTGLKYVDGRGTVSECW